jgi:hypothetical protein
MRLPTVLDILVASIACVLFQGSLLSFEVGNLSKADATTSFLVPLWRTGSNHSWSGGGQGKSPASTVQVALKFSRPPVSPQRFPAPSLATLTHSHVPEKQPPTLRRPSKRAHGPNMRTRRAGLCPRWGPGHWQKCRAALARKLGVERKTCPQSCVTFEQSGRMNNNVRQLAHVFASFSDPNFVPPAHRESILLQPFWNETLRDMVDYDELAKLCIFPSWQQQGRLETCTVVTKDASFRGRIQRESLPREWRPREDMGPFISWIFMAASETTRREVHSNP